ncbi:MAG: DEAD/DEAH box helicase family protein [Dehalococcoidia bacterium]
MLVQLPPIFAIDQRLDGNIIKQLILPSLVHEGTIDNHDKNGTRMWLASWLGQNNEQALIAETAIADDKFDQILQINPLPRSVNNELLEEAIPKGNWIKHPLLPQVSCLPDPNNETTKALASWRGAFQYREEDSTARTEGLRKPQIGAIHAVHAHWAISSEPATIVMPTGTGKTETMIGVLVSRLCERLLVVVPTDALRMQIADKFMSLGILKNLGVVSSTALFPVVGILNHRPLNASGVDTFFTKCNVVITTMAIAGQCPDTAQTQMVRNCPFLFIDEAHHIAASTWKRFKDKFESNRILQFTATPYRNDDRPVDGHIIFNYSLRQAQEDRYFTFIKFNPVMEFDPKKADQQIANQAVKQLEEDCKKYNHVLMARVRDIERAKEVFKLYESYKKYNPVQLHTKIKSIKDRELIRKKLISGESKIVVCVDMLGEGFDLPNLKIAAFHDIKKSLPTTLQLAGRFTRTSTDLGEATFIANIADVNVNDEIDKLYDRDTDWNALLPQTSQNLMNEKINLQEFIKGFGNFPKEISLQNMRPAMSTVIYKTKCTRWTPSNFPKGIDGFDSLEREYHSINDKMHTLVIVTARKTQIDWTRLDQIFSMEWELYVLYWDQGQQLLFINSSSNSGYYKKLAEAIAGEVELVCGQSVFRCLSGVNRLKLQNVGLTQQIGRLIRYMMRAGPDVEMGLSGPSLQNATKSNIFGVGYEDGSKTTIGCSYKGRIWSRRVTNLDMLVNWCSAVGEKINDNSIDPNEVLKGTLEPRLVLQRPTTMAIAIDWPTDIYKEPEAMFTFTASNGVHFNTSQADIRLVDPSENGDLLFEIVSSAVNAKYKLSFHGKDETADFAISQIGGLPLTVKYGTKTERVIDFMSANPPVIWFADGSCLEGNIYTEIKSHYDPYPISKIVAWDWTGINIKKESQGISKHIDSIQYRVIEQLKKGSYDIIFDDDDAGEAADVVTIKVEETHISVEFYHCKFSKEDKPGNRMEDLYTVCGQAQKSIHWMANRMDLFTHLLRRESQRGNRFEIGNADQLQIIRTQCRYLPINLKIFIVQPGLAKASTSHDQQQLLSVTENYLMETYKINFGVIASS